MELGLASAPFKLMKDLNVQTNQKVAVLTDNGPDGLAIGGQIWPALAKQFGYTVAYSASFPVDATQFTSIIADTKQSGADVVLVDSLTPGGVAMRKQMAAAGYTPKVLVMEKGREIAITLDLGVGKGAATVWTCDLTHRYIDINGSYRS